MKNSTMLVALPVFIAMAFSVAFAMNHTTEERGKAHFNNPNFAGGKKACSACHPGGSGLSGVGDKKEFHIMGHQQGSLEEAINFCIVNANRGKAIAEDSTEMQEMVSYLKSLGGK